MFGSDAMDPRECHYMIVCLKSWKHTSPIKLVELRGRKDLASAQAPLVTPWGGLPMYSITVSYRQVLKCPSKSVL